MSNVSRQPRGVPVGGQYAAQTHAEAEGIVLVDPSRDDGNWGDVSNVQEGSRTPWGSAQYVAHTTPGIVEVGCAGHGGVKLSPERNKAIPPALRNSSGWYEEDCEASIVGMAFPDAFSGSMSADDHEEQVKDYFPDGWEKATGGTIRTGESSVRDREQWKKMVEGREVAVSAIRSTKEDGSPNPGWTDVTVEGPGGRRVLRVPSEHYNDKSNRMPVGKHSGTWVAPEDGQFDDITPPPAPPEPAKPVFHGIDTSNATDRQRSAINRDMNQRWSDGNGGVRTLQAVLEGEGFTGKTVVFDGGKRVHYLSTAGNSAFSVSKATWDAVEAPDRRSEREKVAQQVRMAEDRAGKFDSFDDEVRNRDRIKELREKMKAADPERPVF